MAYSAFSVAFLNVFVARDAGLLGSKGSTLSSFRWPGPAYAALSAGEIDYLTGYTAGLVAASRGTTKGSHRHHEKAPFYIVSEPAIQNQRILPARGSR
jgi:hypothetical protein